MRRTVPVVLVLVLAVAAVPVSASTVSPPANLGDLARMSRAVVLAEAQTVRTELRGQSPFTVTRFAVVERVAGEPGASFEVETRGGVVGDLGLVVAGTPRFTPGDRYLLFLDPAPGGDRWRPRMLSYGILREDKASGLLRPVPEAADLHLIGRPGVESITAYRTADLLGRLAAAAAGAPWHPEASAAPEKAGTGSVEAGAPAACHFLQAPDGARLRWFGFETGSSVGLWHTTPGQAGIADGGVAAVQEATAAWTGHPDSVIRVDYAGSRPSTSECSDNIADVLGEVTFNDPCNQLGPLAQCPGTLPPGWTSATCCGSVAEYGYTFDAGAVRSHDGQPWRAMTGMSVVVNDGAQCLGETDFKEMMTHYVGHGLGFGHHTDQQATMYSQLGVHPPRGAALGETDEACASASYHTFLDVSLDYWAWRFIEAIENAGVTGGCGGGNYCPENPIDRQTMAVFLLVSHEGTDYTPPPCTTPVFNDVPCSSPYAPWINELFQRGVVVGCGGGDYCPTNPVTREQMAVFLLATLEPPGYAPPDCTTPTFSDVPCASSFARWVEELVRRGITAGCAPGQYCPVNPVTRAQIAVFLSTTFDLPLP